MAWIAGRYDVTLQFRLLETVSVWAWSLYDQEIRLLKHGFDKESDLTGELSISSDKYTANSKHLSFSWGGLSRKVTLCKFYCICNKSYHLLLLHCTSLAILTGVCSRPSVRKDTCSNPSDSSWKVHQYTVLRDGSHWRVRTWNRCCRHFFPHANVTIESNKTNVATESLSFWFFCEICVWTTHMLSLMIGLTFSKIASLIFLWDVNMFELHKWLAWRVTFGTDFTDFFSYTIEDTRMSLGIGTVKLDLNLDGRYRYEFHFTKRKNKWEHK